MYRAVSGTAITHCAIRLSGMHALQPSNARHVQAVDKFSTEGKADPNPRFQGKSGVDNKVTPKDGDFKNVKPDERK